MQRFHCTLAGRSGVLLTFGLLYTSDLFLKLNFNLILRESITAYGEACIPWKRLKRTQKKFLEIEKDFELSDKRIPKTKGMFFSFCVFI